MPSSQAHKTKEADSAGRGARRRTTSRAGSPFSLASHMDAGRARVAAGMTLLCRYPTPADPLYVAFRDGTGPVHAAIRTFVDSLWDKFSSYADDTFEVEIAQPGKFHSRYWEMYFVSYLLSAGYQVSAPKPGPDARIQFGDTTAWFEATAPSPGLPGLLDSVPEPDLTSDEDSPCPDPRTVLRYRTAIEAKAKGQYQTHRKSGIVGAHDPYVIALNGGTMLDARVDGNRGILAALYGAGGDLILFAPNREPDIVTRYVPEVYKRTSGSTVSTNVFLDPCYRHITAVLFSGVSAGNPLSLRANDFVLLPNPNAFNPLPAACLSSIPEWTASGDPGDGLTLRKRSRAPA